MSKSSRSRTTGRNESPLRAARADSFADWICRSRESHSLFLDDDAYSYLRTRGFSRADVDRVVGDLANAGRAHITPVAGGVKVHVHEPPAKADP